MSNLFEKQVEKKIFKDERKLYPDWAPERILFRESETEELVFALKPASQGKKASNAFVYGTPGTGKTLTSKYVLNELKEYSDKVKCLYVNCFELGTRHSILTKLTNFMGYPVPERGMSADETYERFVGVLRTKKEPLIVVLDEAEQLLKTEDSKKLLYDLSRAHEQVGAQVAVILVTNDNFLLTHLDDRTRSSLQAIEIEFKPYGPIELKQIMLERAKYAFVEGTLTDEALGIITGFAAKNGGDARIAIESLLKAGRLAEKENSSKIEAKHARKALPQERPIKKEMLEGLSAPEKLVLSTIQKTSEKGQELDSGDLIKKLEGKIAERTVRKAVSELEEKNILELEKEQKGKGFTRIIKTKQL
jgi:cell division control protein 6